VVTPPRTRLTPDPWPVLPALETTMDQGSRAVLWFAIVPEQLLSRLMLRSPKGLQPQDGYILQPPNF